MENAAKALIMAGEILIAVLVIGVLVYGYSSMAHLSKEQENDTVQKQLVAFNKEYESYNRKLLRGVDVISVINKATDNNKKHENEEYYKINITFEMVEALAYKKEKVNGNKTIEGFFNVGKRYNMDELSGIENSDAFIDFKRRIFDCIEIGYNSTSGRVNRMHFKERKMSQDEYEYGFGL